MLVFVSIASLAVVIWGIIDVARRPAMVLAPKMEGTLDCWDDRRVVPLRDHRSNGFGLLPGRAAEANERWPILQPVLVPVTRLGCEGPSTRRYPTAVAVILSTCFLMSEPPLLSTQIITAKMCVALGSANGSADSFGRRSRNRAQLRSPQVLRSCVCERAEDAHCKFPNTSLPDLSVGPQWRFQAGGSLFFPWTNTPNPHCGSYDMGRARRTHEA